MKYKILTHRGNFVSKIGDDKGDNLYYATDVLDRQAYKHDLRHIRTLLKMINFRARTNDYIDYLKSHPLTIIEIC